MTKQNVRTYKCATCGSDHIYALPMGVKHPAKNTCPGCKQPAALQPKK